MTHIDKLLVYPAAIALVILALTGCLGPGEGREVSSPARHPPRPDKPAAADLAAKPTPPSNPTLGPKEPASGDPKGKFGATPLSDELYLALLAACDTYDIPACVGLGLVEVESGFDPEAVSPAGCYGLCQLNPKYFPVGLSPEENLMTGLSYLAGQMARYDTLEAALTAYNAGYDTGSRTYSAAVLAAAQRWEAAIKNPPAEADG